MCVCVCVWYGILIFTVHWMIPIDKWTILYLNILIIIYLRCIVSIYIYRRIDLKYYCRIVDWGVFYTHVEVNGIHVWWQWCSIHSYYIACADYQSCALKLNQRAINRPITTINNKFKSSWSSGLYKFDSKN